MDAILNGKQQPDRKQIAFNQMMSGTIFRMTAEAEASNILLAFFETLKIVQVKYSNAF